MRVLRRCTLPKLAPKLSWVWDVFMPVAVLSSPILCIISGIVGIWVKVLSLSILGFISGSLFVSFMIVMLVHEPVRTKVKFCGDCWKRRDEEYEEEECE